MAVAIWQLNFTLHYFKTILCACISRTSLQNNARILLEKVEEREGETLTMLLIKNENVVQENTHSFPPLLKLQFKIYKIAFSFKMTKSIMDTKYITNENMK